MPLLVCYAIVGGEYHMPNTKSVVKRMRQNEVRRVRNKDHRTGLRNAVKAFRAVEDPAAAKEQLPKVVSTIDKSVKKGIVHHRTAARMKSRLAKKANG